MIPLLLVSTALAADLYVLVLNPHHAIAEARGGAVASLTSVFGVADRLTVEHAAEPVQQGFAEIGIEASVTVERLKLTEPLSCLAQVFVPPPSDGLLGALQSGYQTQEFALERGRHWTLHVITGGGFKAWMADWSGATHERLFRRFREQGAEVALCEPPA